MAERVIVKVKAGQMLATPGGQLIQEGETVEVSAHEADFFERMGAAQIVAPQTAAEETAAEETAADRKPAKKAKNGPQSQ